jgi:hypothetical protein
MLRWLKSRTYLGVVLALSLSALFLSAFRTYLSEQSVERETMQRANQLYEEGLYYEASQTYQQLVDQGFEDASLFYNLGNAFYKDGDLGRAILNYERARRLAPRDTDIRANLGLARGQALDQYEIESSSLLEDWVGFATAFLTMNELSVLVLVSLWVVVALVIAMNHIGIGILRRGMLIAIIGMAVVFVGSALTLGSVVLIEKQTPAAIVVASKVQVMSAPNVEAVVLFDLHAGAQVRILEERGSWRRVTLPGEEFQGWMEEGEVEEVG